MSALPTINPEAELREAARLFHNLTQGDSEVIIRARSAEKRDAIAAAGQRLRDAITACVQCRICGDSGDVHDLTGEWRGYCECSAGRDRRSIDDEHTPRSE